MDISPLPPGHTRRDSGSFTLRLGSFPILFGRYSTASLEFPDSKGVGGKIAGVEVEPGGSVWRLVVTTDGEMPYEGDPAEEGIGYAEAMMAGGNTVDPVQATEDSESRRETDRLERTIGGLRRALSSELAGRRQANDARDETERRYAALVESMREKRNRARDHAVTAERERDQAVTDLAHARSAGASLRRQRDEAINRAERLETELRSLQERSRGMSLGDVHSTTIVNETSGEKDHQMLSSRTVIQAGVVTYTHEEYK